MAIEVDSVRAVCGKCGTDYSRQKGYFPVSYATLYKGIGHTHICKDCIDSIYSGYLAECKNAPDAVRQVCRKLDLYWGEKVYKIVERKSTTRSMMTQYIAKINSVTYAGKSYDDTLLEEGTLWSFGHLDTKEETSIKPILNIAEKDETEETEIPPESMVCWGLGFSSEQYEWLDQRKLYYETKWPGIFDGEAGIGNDILIRQLCIQEVSNMQDMASGKGISQGIGALNNIIGSLNLKPSQKSDSADCALSKQPLGMLAKKIEERHPIKHNSKRENKLIHYILIWYYGHGCKSLGIQNVYSRMYEEEMDRLRVKHPEFQDTPDDEFLSNIFENVQNETNEVIIYDESAN